MRQPSSAFYIALLFGIHFLGIKLYALLVVALVSVAWRLICQFKLQVAPPDNAAAFVTGASSGIGLETSIQLASRGIVVFAGVRKAKDGEDVKKQAGKNAKFMVPVICDVCDTSSVQSAAKTVAEEIRARNLTGLFSLCSIAGVMPYSAVEVVSDEKNRQTFEVKYFGVVRTVQAFAPLLREFTSRTTSRAHVVLVSSMGGP
jgi:NAD(P)-dependent dehydrogenase (short-subunit alcohol dehydrogenase family)